VKYELLMARAGEGAGDQLLALNCAHAWANWYNTPVELEYHWTRPEDFKFVEGDPERMAERTDLMHSKMLRSELVTIEHVWGSDVFEYHNTQHNDRLRGKLNPKRWFFPLRDEALHGNRGIPFGQHAGAAEWEFAEQPTQTKTIAVWDYAKNKHPPQEIKIVREYLWEEIREKLAEVFPDHKIIHLTYRDSFEKAYSTIRDCQFCVGYDGMWHLVARNFGKLFVNHTHNMAHSHSHTNPLCSAFRTRQVLEYIELLGEEGFFKNESRVASKYHDMRMGYYGNCRR